MTATLLGHTNVCCRLNNENLCWHMDFCIFCHPLKVAWWRHQMEPFSPLLAICAGNSPVNSLHKGQWRGALMFSLICVWINGWVNNREAGDLRRYRAHYDVIVMSRKRPASPAIICYEEVVHIESYHNITVHSLLIYSQYPRPTEH